ncbi:MAG: hypothetical protein ACRDRA_21670 [Pseudonocardiaceae bacterium]
MSGQVELAALMEVSAAEQTAQPLPEGVFHLLVADDDLTQHPFRFQMRSTVCGEVLQPSSLPPSCFGDEVDGDREPRYCPECVREAVRWSAAARGVPGE